QMIREVQMIVHGLIQRKRQMLEPMVLYCLGKENALKTEELMIYFGETPQLEQVAKRYDQLPITSMRELAIDGKKLLSVSDKKPGKWVSDALQAAERAVVEGNLANEASALVDYLQQNNH